MIYKLFKGNKPILILLSALILALVGCGGGGGGGGGGSGAQTKTISGDVLVPSTMVSQFDNQTMMYSLANFLFPTVGAAVTGLEPVPGALVELIEVDDNGVQKGGVLASTSTSITGDYKLSLPAGLDFAANLIVRITGLSTDLRAQVVEQKVDITPVSEFVLRKFIENGTKLSTLPTTEVVTLKGHVDEFDIAATSDLTSMLAQLESEMGDFVDNTIASIGATPGLASSIAGGMHYMYDDIGFRYLNDPMSWSNSSQNANNGIGEIIILDEDADKFGIQNVSENDTYIDMSTLDNVSYGLWFETNINNSNDTESNIGTIDAGGNIFLSFPFEEEIWTDSDHGVRYPPSNEKLYASGTDGIIIATVLDRGVIYRLNVAKNAVDPASKVGQHAQFGLSVLAPTTSGLTVSAINGDYGVVYLHHYLTHQGLYVAETGIVDITILDGSLTETAQDASNITFTPNGNGTATISELTQNTLDTGILSVQENGALTYADASTVTVIGFASGNSEMLTMAVSDSTSDMSIVTAAISGHLMAVKKPSTKPDLSNRTYRLIGVETIMDISGQKNVERIKGDDDRLSFNADATQVTEIVNGIDKLIQPLNNANYTLSATADSANKIHDVTIGTTGKISFVETDASYTRTWSGYVSESGNIIVLSVIHRQNDESKKSAGNYIAIPVN